MGKSSRDKGARGERELANIYKERGFKCRRAGNSLGLADCVGVPGLHIEVKRQEKLNIWAAMDQAEGDAREGEIPTVHYRRNRSDWWVTLPLSDFIDLLDR